MKGDKAEYVIPLRQAFNTPKTRRADKAIFLIREFVKKHTRASEKDIAISNEVNQLVWKQSRTNIPRKVDAVLRRENKKVFVFLKGGKEMEQRAAKVEEPKEKKKKEASKKEEKKAGEKAAPKSEAKQDAKAAGKPEEKKPSEKEVEDKKKLEEKREKEKNAMKADFK